MNVSETHLKNFWDLESIGIHDSEAPTPDPVLCEFYNTVQFSDDRYVVLLPWKSESVRPTLLNNERLAMSRLDQSARSLARKPELEARYHGVFCEMQKEGVIEEVPSDEVTSANPIFYMPHRPVLKESSLTTKVRPVFDASAKGFNGVSLNDWSESDSQSTWNLDAFQTMEGRIVR